MTANKDFTIVQSLQVNESITLGNKTIIALVDSSDVSSVAQEDANITAIKSAAVSSVKDYDSAELLPASGNNTGDFGFVGSTNRLYLWNGSGWYNIALINTSPTLTTTPDSNYSMDSTGASLSITILATDPEEVPITYSYVASDSAADLVTISQSDNVFTVSSLTQTQLDSNGYSNGGTFTITFRASDGINIAPAVSSFTLSLGINWSATFASPTEVLISTTQTQNDSYGQAVAIVGDTAVVGTGASVEGADIYSKSGGSWSHVQKILPTDTASGDQFGLQVLITPDENNIIVSSPGQDDGQTMAGKVYTFSKSGSTWSQSSSFQAPNPQYIYSTFGRTILLSPDGTILAVGQPGYDGNSNTNTGRILIYTGSGSSWTYRTFILPSTATNQQIGGHYASALSNDTLAFRFGNGGVYVYTGSGASWSQQQLITDSSPTALNSGASIALGSAIAISGDNLALGASGADSSKGAVFVYTRSGSTWSLQQKIQPSGILAGEGLGYGTLRFHPDDADILFASAATTDSGSGNTDTGSVFIFQRSGSTWSQVNRIDNPGYNGNAPAGQANFSISHDVSNADLLIGAPQQHTNSSNTTWNTGAAYFYEA